MLGLSYVCIMIILICFRNDGTWGFFFGFFLNKGHLILAVYSKWTQIQLGNLYMK